MQELREELEDQRDLNECLILHNDRLQGENERLRATLVDSGLAVPARHMGVPSRQAVETQPSPSEQDEQREWWTAVVGVAGVIILGVLAMRVMSGDAAQRILKSATAVVGSWAASFHGNTSRCK